MKKITLLSIILFTSVAAFSQDFKPFRVGLGLGYANPSGDGSKSGILVYLEPSYRVSDAITVGLKLESAVMFRGTVITSGNTTSVPDGTISGSASYTVNGQYYFSNNSFRPFVGLGFGMYQLASASFTYASSGNSSSTTNSDAVSAGTKFGFYPRVGFDAGHFTMNVEYNIIPSSSSSVTINSNGVVSNGVSDTKNSYLGVRVGFFIGGGRS